jgi:hypothetical protein
MNKEQLPTIPVLSWESIAEIFNCTKRDIERDLTKPNNAANYWYPHSENGYDELDTKSIIAIFEFQFPDIEISSRHDYKYTEVFLNTLDKHQFAFSVIDFLTQKADE